MFVTMSRLYTPVIMIRLYRSVIRGGFRGGVRGVRPPKIRKAYMLYNVN
jgi:hypothetical protein